MANSKPEIKYLPAQGDDEIAHYEVRVKDANGNTRVQDKANTIEPMEETQAALVFLGLAKDAPNKRVAAVTLLSAVMTLCLDKIEAWKGNCDKSKGIPNELKGAFQDGETSYFQQFMDAKHPDHAIFLKRLPTADARGNELTVGGKLNKEAQFQAFMANTRKEPSYANAKNTVLGAFGYLGMMPVADDGNLIPPEILRVMVSNVRIVAEQDNSFKGQLYAMHRWLIAGEKDAPPDDDMPEIVATLRELLAAAETLEKAAAVRRTARAKPGDVVQQTKDALEAANGKAKPAPAPSDKAKKVTEPAN